MVSSQTVGWKVRLSAQEYAEAYEVSLDSAYEQLKQGADSLMKTVWKTVDHDPSVRGKKGTLTTTGPWLTLGEYRDGEGTADITFHWLLTPYLLALRKEFTTYKLKHAAALRSIYAWRLFECLQSWKKKGVWRVDIEDFHKAMDAPDSCKADFGRLKKRVIEPAIKELTAKNSMFIECHQEKAGRKVIALEFRFGHNPQGQLDI
jgi:plasmid replication initiation protein